MTKIDGAIINISPQKIGESLEFNVCDNMNAIINLAPKKETVTLEKNVYDIVLKNNARLMEENENLRGALEFILETTKKDNPSIEALRFVAYTALKDTEKYSIRKIPMTIRVE